MLTISFEINDISCGLHEELCQSVFGVAFKATRKFKTHFFGYGKRSAWLCDQLPISDWFFSFVAICIFEFVFSALSFRLIENLTKMRKNLCRSIGFNDPRICDIFAAIFFSMTPGFLPLLFAKLGNRARHHFQTGNEQSCSGNFYKWFALRKRGTSLGNCRNQFANMGQHGLNQLPSLVEIWLGYLQIETCFLSQNGSNNSLGTPIYITRYLRICNT